MKIDDVLAEEPKSKINYAQDDLYYMTGGISSDTDPKFFRFYRDPEDVRSFMIISKSDVVGEIHELTEAERVLKGHSCSNVYRIAIKHGTPAKLVSISLAKLGEQISAVDSDKMVPSNISRRMMADRPGIWQTSGQHCHYTSGCWTNCCTHGNGFGHRGPCYCDFCCYAYAPPSLAALNL